MTFIFEKIRHVSDYQDEHQMNYRVYFKINHIFLILELMNYFVKYIFQRSNFEMLLVEVMT